jgi:hypothetical protein
MKQIVAHTSLLLLLFLASCASQTADAQSEAPEFRVRASNAEDAIAILAEDSLTIIDIQSDFGIGSATFDLIAGTMPRTLTVRLHLRGLEEFRVVSGEATVGASLSTGGAGFPVSQRIVSSDGEIPILLVHPLWLDIRTVPESASLPLEEGYFEIVLPETFLQGAGTLFELHWVDFYR